MASKRQKSSLHVTNISSRFRVFIYFSIWQRNGRVSHISNARCNKDYTVNSKFQEIKGQKP